jgi:hypothetical protein
MIARGHVASPAGVRFWSEAHLRDDIGVGETRCTIDPVDSDDQRESFPNRSTVVYSRLGRRSKRRSSDFDHSTMNSQKVSASRYPECLSPRTERGAQTCPTASPRICWRS